MDESASDIAELWRDYKEGGTTDARERLILHYSPLVKFVAGRVAAGLPQNIEQSDLVSYGIFGLIDAIDKFDPGRGYGWDADLTGATSQAGNDPAPRVDTRILSAAPATWTCNPSGRERSAAPGCRWSTPRASTPGRRSRSLRPCHWASADAPRSRMCGCRMM